jgi:hypothetical protein
MRPLFVAVVDVLVDVSNPCRDIIDCREKASVLGIVLVVDSSTRNREPSRRIVRNILLNDEPIKKIIPNTTVLLARKKWRFVFPAVGFDSNWGATRVQETSQVSPPTREADVDVDSLWMGCMMELMGY